MPHDGHRQVTYFGIYSSAQKLRVAALLSSLGANFYFEPCRSTEEILREWTAWDPDAVNPTACHDLWIHSSDLGRVGTHIVDMFPERKFGAP
jgi:hypothetical protein